MRFKWQPFLTYGQNISRKKGITLYSQGEKSEGFYYLAEGQISIYILSEDGKERVIDYLIDGYLFGEQGISNEPYSTTAIANTEVYLYYFSSQDFVDIVREHPDAKNIFISSLIGKVRMLADTFSILNKPYEKQMAYFLSQLCQKYNSRIVPITQTALAQYIGTSRVTVYKIIQKWVSYGWIALRNREIEVIDPSKLKALL